MAPKPKLKPAVKNRMPMKPSAERTPVKWLPIAYSATISALEAIITPTPISSVSRRPMRSTRNKAATVAITENTSIKA
jgi:hypothetical protein